MATTSITTHIPPEAEPEKLLSLLIEMNNAGLAFSSLSSLLDFADEHGLGRRSELTSFSRLFGFLVQDKSGDIELTDNGRLLANAKSDLRADIAHYCIYTAYDPARPDERTESWAYQQVVNGFWLRSPVDVHAVNGPVVEEINNAAYDLFEVSISFSPKSIRGVRKWLEALHPPVIEGDVFKRRNFCSPELLLLAIGHVARQTEAELNIDLLLTMPRREAICRLCLLEPAALDRALNWMLPLYPAIVLPGTTAGTYGRFLRFLRWPTVADVAAR